VFPDADERRLWGAYIIALVFFQGLELFLRGWYNAAFYDK
jgi:hypothetical protein